MVFLLPLLETMIQSCILLEWVGFFSLAAIWLNVRCIYLPRLPVLPFCSTFKCCSVCLVQLMTLNIYLHYLEEIMALLNSIWNILLVTGDFNTIFSFCIYSEKRSQLATFCDDGSHGLTHSNNKTRIKAYFS